MSFVGSIHDVNCHHFHDFPPLSLLFSMEDGVRGGTVVGEGEVNRVTSPKV